jgi:hypothetical protein
VGEKSNARMILIGKPEGKRPLWRPRSRWENNIKIHLRNIGCGGMDCIDLAKDRDQWRALVNAVMNLRVLWNVGDSWVAELLVASEEELRRSIIRFVGRWVGLLTCPYGSEWPANPHKAQRFI